MPLDFKYCNAMQAIFVHLSFVIALLFSCNPPASHFDSLLLSVASPLLCLIESSSFPSFICHPHLSAALTSKRLAHNAQCFSLQS